MEETKSRRRQKQETIIVSNTNVLIEFVGRVNLIVPKEVNHKIDFLK